MRPKIVLSEDCHGRLRGHIDELNKRIGIGDEFRVTSAETLEQFKANLEAVQAEMNSFRNFVREKSKDIVQVLTDAEKVSNY
jgi:hypothetical protein